MNRKRGEFPRKVVPGEAFFFGCTWRDPTFKFILIVVDPSEDRKTGFLQRSTVMGFSSKEELLLFSESLGKGTPEEIPFVPSGEDFDREGIISEYKRRKDR